MPTIFSYFRKILKRAHPKKKVIKDEHIIPRTQHCLSKTDISENALKVLNRLNTAGYESYLVGGSVRDLLLRKVPKDFDITTNATPQQIKKLFRNARIIGRRFKIVHILFYREVIEVATFRASATLHDNLKANEKGMLIQDNVFGTMEEDIWRRDFTINALLYDINQSAIIDLTGGYQHLRDKTIHIIGDAQTRYKEDPVRMLRALRFSAKLEFDMDEATAKPIHSLIHLIQHVSPSRLFDEITKLYQCGHALKAHQLTVQFGLYQLLLPQTADVDKQFANQRTLIQIALENTDRRIHENKPVTPAFIFAIILWFPLIALAEKMVAEGQEPLVALEKSMSDVLSNQCQLIAIPKRFTIVIREIWLLQYRFTKRVGNRAFQLLNHPRFRAAYDFLAIRALAGDADMDIADWWTTFQEASHEDKEAMIAKMQGSPGKKRRRRRAPIKREIKDD